ncbi:MAG: hypothetical protein NTW18_02255 [Candidatus Omnitrophica bacterium]|nr:hypothetical protein [Candidatus Omnitrophota bacterium]
MCMLGKMAGYFALVPATMLLVVSFFVLFTLGKVVSRNLKLFGAVIVALLWLSALLIFSTGAYTTVKGRPPFKCPMMEMMKGKQDMMPGGMMQAPQPK